MLQIHEKIKQARIAADLTEAELAKKVGVKRSTYQYWEVVTPSVAKIKSVAKALGKDEDYFFTNDETFVETPPVNQKKEEDKDKTIADLAYSTRQLVDNNTDMVKMHREFLEKFYASLSKTGSARARDRGGRKGTAQDDPLDLKISGKRK